MLNPSWRKMCVAGEKFAKEKAEEQNLLVGGVRGKNWKNFEFLKIFEFFKILVKLMHDDQNELKIQSFKIVRPILRSTAIFPTELW